MDDDATTIARLSDALPHPIAKWSDLNHTRNHLTSHLYTLAKSHKELMKEGHKPVKAIQKYFLSAVKRNAGNEEGLIVNFKAIVPHVFGDHKDCQSWCHFVQNTANHKYGNIPIR